MKFSYVGRDQNGKKISGVIDSQTRKGAMIDLKKKKIIVIKIKEYKEKKKLGDLFKNQTKTKIETKSKENKSSFFNNISSRFKFTPKKDRVKASELLKEKDKVEEDKLKDKYSFNELNNVLQKNELFEQLKAQVKEEVKEEIKDIDVDAIMNSDFKNAEVDFKKEDTKKPSILTAEFDVDTLKKLLNTDLGGGNKSKDGIKRSKSKKVKNKELLMFCKKLSTLLSTGIPITRCLQTLMQQSESEYFQKVLAIVTKDIAQGSSLSESMAKFPNVFSAHFTALVKTGESTGELSKTFELLYKEILESEKLKGKVIGASVYPGVILSVLFIAFIVAAVFLVPMFNNLFEGMGLPRFTEIVFGFLTFFKDNLFFIIGGIILSVIILKFALRNISLKYRFDLLKLNLPVLGEVITQYHTINILRTMDIALKNGLSMVDSVELAIQTTENIAFKLELQKVLNKIIQGIPLSVAMKESPVFPTLCVQMLSIGEESGKMGELIEKTLDYYDWALNDFIDKSSKLIEPVAIIFVGIFVVIFVFAVAIPMFDLSSGAMIE